MASWVGAGTLVGVALGGAVAMSGGLGVGASGSAQRAGVVTVALRSSATVASEPGGRADAGALAEAARPRASRALERRRATAASLLLLLIAGETRGGARR